MLAQILLRLEAEPQLRAQLGYAAARRAGEFSGDSIAPQITGAYDLARQDAGAHLDLASHLPWRSSRPT